MEAGKDKYILVINGGSSSLKFSLCHAITLQIALSGAVNHIGAQESYMEIHQQERVIFQEGTASCQTLADSAKALINWFMENKDRFFISAIGHRIVQGGPEHREPETITTALLEKLKQYIYLAPNHLPEEIKTIAAFKSAFPDTPQVACFDTSFHRHLPAVAKYYPLPIEYQHKGLMRYGFHGLSYEYILQKLKEKNPEVISKKIIIAHLGNGASMAAVVNGISADTTMGLSPAGGLVMGTRAGDLDPGVILFLLKEGKLSTAALDEVVNKKSGLKAIAGTSDLQELLKKEAVDPQAKAALAVFCYQAKKFIGALAAAMGGLDLLVFTGGIGENSAIIRERICENMDFMGIQINNRSNRAMKEVISSKAAKVSIRMMKTSEEYMIAQHTQHIINHRK